MKGGMWMSIGVLVLSGCVSSATYGELKAKHDHLLSVKEHWEGEQQAIEERVENTTRAYHHVSVEQGNLKAQNDQVLTAMRTVKDEVRNTNSKVDRQEVNLRAHEERMVQMEGRFTELMTNVATMAETNHALANRVDQLLIKMSKTVQAKAPTDVPKVKASQAELKKSVRAKSEEGVSAAVSPVEIQSTGMSDAEPTRGEKMAAEKPVDGTAVLSTSAAVEKGLQQRLPMVQTATGPVPASEFQANRNVGGAGASTPQKERSTWRELLDKLRPSVVKQPESPKPTVAGTPSAHKPGAEALAPRTEGQAFAAPPSSALTISSTPGVVVPAEPVDSKAGMPPTK